MSSQQTSQTLASAFVTEATEDLNEATTTVFTPEYLLKKLNRGQVFIAAMSKCLEKKQTEQMVDGQLFYPLVRNGSHSGGTHATILTATAPRWISDRLIGQTVWNLTDKSSGVITANTIKTATVAALTGGTDNEWKSNDLFLISHRFTAIKTVVYNQTHVSQKGLLRGNIQSVGHNEVADEPVRWAESENNVVIYPKPDSEHSGNGHNLDVYLTGIPSTILSTDMVVLPACYDDALLFYMVAAALHKDSKHTSAGLFKKMCENEVIRYRMDFVTPPKEPREIVR